MSKAEAKVMVVNRDGMHARPVTQFSQLANQFESKIEVSKGDLTVNAKSIMSMLRLAAEKGSILRIRADGKDAALAVKKLSELVEHKFGME